MYSLDPRTALRWGTYLLLGIFLALGVRGFGAGRVSDDPARDILAVDLARRAHANALALDSARKALVQDTRQVERTIVRYSEIRDTLNLTDTVQVKVFVERADSVVRSCIQLSESCDRFRVRADSSMATLTTDRDFWKARYEHSRPSKWAPVKEWGIRALIGYGAFKLGSAR